MKKLIAPSAALVVLLTACGDNSQSGSSGNPATAPVDYLKAATDAEKKAVKTVDTVALNQAIQMFNVQEGRLPKDLNELVEKKYLSKLPEPPHGMKLVYDARKGTVSVEKQ
jgi:hypothetical protein